MSAPAAGTDSLFAPLVTVPNRRRWTIVGLPMAVYAVRRGRTAIHKRAMTGMFVGGLLIAGALSFLPGRFMFEFLLG